ncbi:hypothetical protein WJX75_001857 [Coccomyxa subellipsoidea]|uniref:ENTH domain-containing protein n=1 Tax=Coccomyxa subellipsoidea TaxID=248742 RepID=A0ABR2YBG3_9CHLO
MSSKGTASADKSLSVAEYSRQFFERVTKGTYGETLEENRRVAGENFISLVKKLQDAGSKDDIKVPLRVLRDEIGRVFFSGVGHKKAENIETLFQLYDMLEADCQDTLKGGRTVPSKEAATATQLLDELRNRFVRLAVGETWEKFPELKFLALKRMYKYMVREQESLRMKGKLGITSAGSGSGKFNQKFMRSITMSPGGATWQLALDDLVKSPSNKLFPFVKLLLAENLLLETSEASGDASSAQEAKSIEGGTSNASDMNMAPRATSDFSLDDLLGLGPYPSTPGGDDKAPDTPAFDPFQHSLETRPSQTPQGEHTFEASFPEAPPAAAAAAAPSSNPFGASSFGQPSFPANHTPVPQQAPLRAGSSGVYFPPPASFAQQQAGGLPPPPLGGSAGPSRSSSTAAALPPVPTRTSSGSGFPPPSPTASAEGLGGSAFTASPHATRSFSASSETELPVSPTGSGAFPAAGGLAPTAATAGEGHPQQVPPTPANSSSLGEQAFATSFPPLQQASFLPAPSQQQTPSSLMQPAQMVTAGSGFGSTPLQPPPLSTAGSGLGSPSLQHTGSGGVGATPTPALKAPPRPARQLSGTFSSPRAGSLARANSSGPAGGLARAASGAFSPPLRTASLGVTASGSFGSEGFSPPAPATSSLARGTSSSENGSGHFVAPVQLPGQGSGDLAPASKPFSPNHAAPNPSPFQPQTSSQAPQPQFAAFQDAPIANGSSEHSVPTGTAVDIPGSQDAGNSFNPFGLPSPSFASPVPAFADNRFADVSPMSNAPPPPVPQPMRAPPAPPGHAPNRQYSAW